MKKKLTNIALVLVFFLGLSLLLYPSFANYWNSFTSSKAIAAYTEQLSQIDREDYAKYWEEAQQFNRDLQTRENPYELDADMAERYEKVLDISGSGVMGYIEIPAIQVELPVYHGTSDGVLQVAIGHLDWTSLPIGGESSHCVVSGHRGLPSAKLFTDLDELVVGDQFLLHVLDKTLTYQIDQILIVEPDKIAELMIQEGKDLCTLVTCTPYGVNSHRMLVRGHRVANAEEEVTVRVAADAIQIEPLVIAPVVGIPMLMILFMAMILMDSKKNKKKFNPDEEVQI